MYELFYSNRSLLCSAGGCTEPKLGKEWSCSSKKGTLYAQTSLWKRKTEKSLLKIEPGTADNGKKEEGIVNESELAVSSILNEEQKTAMRKTVKASAFLCFIHLVGIKYFAEKLTPSVVEDVSGKTNFVLTDSLFNVQRDRIGDYME